MNAQAQQQIDEIIGFASQILILGFMVAMTRQFFPRNPGNPNPLLEAPKKFAWPTDAPMVALVATDGYTEAYDYQVAEQADFHHQLILSEKGLHYYDDDDNTLRAVWYDAGTVHDKHTYTLKGNTVLDPFGKGKSQIRQFAELAIGMGADPRMKIKIDDVGLGTEYEGKVIGTLADFMTKNPGSARRTTVRKELSALDRAYRRTAYDTDPKIQSARQILDEIMGHYSEEQAVVVEENREIVGIAVYGTALNKDFGTMETRIYELASLTLEPGVGGMLVHEVEQIARGHKADLVILSYGPGARGFYEKLGYVDETRSPIEEGMNLMVKWLPRNPGNPGHQLQEAGLLYHGTYSVDDLSSIICDGLRVGSSVSTRHGQASTYPIILEFRGVHAEPVSYRPEDYITTATARDLRTIYFVRGIFGAGVRPVDEINAELATRLADLEAQGLSPEEVAEMPRPTLYRADKRTAQLLDELDRWSARGESPGEEGVLKQVKAAAGSIPVVVLSRDEEGEPDWLK